MATVKMPHLIKPAGKLAWVVRVRVPEDARGAVGQAVLSRSTGERHPGRAMLASIPIIRGFKERIGAARGCGGVQAPVSISIAAQVKDMARVWREAGGDHPHLDAEEVMSWVLEHVAGVRLPGPALGGAGESREHDLAALEALDTPAARRAIHAFETITGSATGFSQEAQAWIAACPALRPRTAAQYVREIEAFEQAHPGLTMQDLTERTVQTWVTARVHVHGDARETLKRRLAALRAYWLHLVGEGFVERGNKPFGDITIPKAAGAAPEDRRAFSVAEVVGLHAEALKEPGGAPLADLILMAAYTGGRIEELCQLRPASWNREAGTLRLDSKTAAGRRDVPVVAGLQAVLERLAEAAGEDQRSSGEYLIPSNPKNRYGQRSKAHSNHFGRLKTRAGYGEEYVFHSFRKTVATRLKTVGCPEAIAADLLGHKLTTMSYGVYAAGSDMEDRRRWMEMALVYPWRS